MLLWTSELTNRSILQQGIHSNFLHKYCSNLASPICGKMFFIIVDAHLKWPEVHEMSSSSSLSTILVLRWIFAAYDLPLQTVFDNDHRFDNDHSSCQPSSYLFSKNGASVFNFPKISFLKSISGMLHQKFDELSYYHIHFSILHDNLYIFNTAMFSKILHHQ